VRLATRTGLAAFAAASIAVVLAVAIAGNQFQAILRGRVDDELRARAESAAILVAVGDRVAVSELNPTVDGARVLRDGSVTEIGRLPTEPLPPITRPGWRTATADGEDWRLYALEVADVPAVGDRSIIELAAPLGDVDARARTLRRNSAFAALVVAMIAGLAGWLFGRRAARPLTLLRDDAARLEREPATAWSVGTHYGTPEVDDVATTLNATFAELGAAIARRDEALESARSFAASASHELRTPLQSATSSLDIARRDPSTGDEAISTARHELHRMATTLGALAALAEADLADPSWFQPTDVVDVVDSVVAGATRANGVEVRQVGAERALADVWADGIRLAVENLVRNARTHGARPDGAGHVVVTVEVDPVRIVVDDDGPGFGAGDRTELFSPFVRGETPVAGSGLGLAFVDRVARVHGGSARIGTSEWGGGRVEMLLQPGR
jgi:two-component system sensor histidine kinase PrrB